MRILTATARLLDELGFGLARNRDRFFVGNLRFTDIGFDVEFALHAVVQDLEVQLAHSGNDGLSCFFIGGDTECGIFLG